MVRNILISADGESGKVTFKASRDIDDFAVIYLDVDRVIESGEIQIDMENLIKTAVIKNHDLTIESEDHGNHSVLKIRSRKKNFDVCGNNEIDFVGFPKLEDEKLLCIADGSEFLEKLDGIACALAPYEANKLMWCFNLDFAKRRIAALDGHRIGIAKLYNEYSQDLPEFEIMENLDGNQNYSFFSYKVLKAVAGKKNIGKFRISADKKYVKITGEDFTIFSRMIDGEYFKIDEMLKIDRDYAYKVNSKDLAEIAKEYKKIIGTETNPMVIAGVEGNLYTCVRVPEMKTSDYVENVKFEYGNEKEFLAGFNPVFIMDALKTINDKARIIGTFSSKVPIMISDDRYDFLLLPVNIMGDDLEYMGIIKDQIAA